VKTADELRIEIDEEFESLIPASSAKENAELKAAIEKDGRFTDPLFCWKGTNIIIDGHRRYKVWQSLPEDTAISPPSVEMLEFPNREAAKHWMLLRQLSRRNLSPQSAKLLRGRLYLQTKDQHGGDRRSESAAQKTANREKLKNSPTHSEEIGHGHDVSLKNGDTKTAQIIAKETGVTERTIHRDAAYVEALDSIGKVNSKAKSDIESGSLKVPNKDVIAIGKLAATEIGAALKKLRNGEDWKSATPPAASVVKDALDRDVPKYLAAHHAAAAEISSAGTKLDQLKKLVGELASKSGGEFLEMSRIEDEIRALKSRITFSRYWTDCPRCQGKLNKKCDRCDGHGFLPHSRKSSLSDEDRAYLGIEK
jgi:hypothetical protein